MKYFWGYSWMLLTIIRKLYFKVLVDSSVIVIGEKQLVFEIFKSKHFKRSPFLKKKRIVFLVYCYIDDSNTKYLINILCTSIDIMSFF